MSVCFHIYATLLWSLVNSCRIFQLVILNFLIVWL
jgi:hypothetical protein